MKLYLPALALLCLTGCATSRTTPPPRTSVPAARRFESYLLKPSHRRTCPVTIVREPGVAGSGLNLFLDGDQIARVTVGEVMTVYLKPGRHLLVAKPLFSPPANVRLQLRSGGATTVHITDRDGNFAMKAVVRTRGP
ncbi:MAG: hypothetical protein H0X40_07270 [Chthoniobacterales bacterium]|nr:hypothetical protein [Chthoniobacterales bacterium]